MHYNIITDETELDQFINFLPETNPQEVYYICLFGRHKYCKGFPNTRDSGQLARVTGKRDEIKTKLRRLECPINAYVRDGVPAPQEALACYISLNPRSLIKANRELMIELATRFADGNTEFNPITLATTCVHRAVDRKFFVDFDFDEVEPEEYAPKIKNILPDDSYRILKTRGGFHLLVLLEKAKVNSKFYPQIAALPKCDVKGANTLTPIPGCTQGGFTPHFV